MIDAPAAARIESIDADCTTLIMRGLNRQVSRDMVVTLLSLGQMEYMDVRNLIFV